MKKLTLVFVVITIAQCSLWSQWEMLTTDFEDSNNTIYFLNEDTGYVGGNVGNFNTNFYRTTNGGYNWDLINISELTTIRDIEFVNDTNGFMVSSYPYAIYYTNDGGFNWSKHPQTLGNYCLISFWNEDTGFIYSPSGSSGINRYTVDGGLTWNTDMYHDHNIGIETMDFYSETDPTGYFLGWSGKIYKTLNGGMYWVQIAQPASSLYDTEFVNADVGYASGDGFIIKTTDGGYNWDVINDSIGGMIYLRDNNMSYLYNDKVLYYSPDSFNTIIEYPLPDYYGASDIHFVTDSMAYLCVSKYNSVGIMKFVLPINNSNSEVSFSDAVRVYPIPASDQLIIESAEELTYQIIDQKGMVVLHGNNNNSNSIDVSELASGQYYFSYRGDKIQKVISILIE